MIEDTKQTQEEIKPAEDTGERDKSEGTGLVDGANAAAQRLEKANEEKRKLLDREEKLLARRALSGTAEGAQQPPKKEEISDVEYAKNALSGKIDG